MPMVAGLAAPLTGTAKLVEALGLRLRTDGAQLLLAEPVLGVYPAEGADPGDDRRGYRVVTSSRSPTPTPHHLGRTCDPRRPDLSSPR